MGQMTPCQRTVRVVNGNVGDISPTGNEKTSRIFWEELKESNGSIDLNRTCEGRTVRSETLFFQTETSNF